MATAAPAVTGDAARYAVDLEVAARTASARGRGELVAGARLEMSARRSADGGLALELEGVLEDPWKLFSIDPTGPFGRQTKMAAVVTLPEASWEALDTARVANSRRAVERHAAWTPASGRKPRLDGAFAFIVIGPAAGRFSVELGRTGGVERVVNRVTDRWLSGDFDRFVGDWGSAGERPGAPRGYWFWNQGEAEAPSWEPRTYRALAEALGLLGPRSAAGEEILHRAGRVVATLAPGSRLRVAAAPARLEWDERRLESGESIAVGSAKTEEAAIERRVALDSAGRIVSERLDLRIERPREALRLSIAIEPAPANSRALEQSGP